MSWVAVGGAVAGGAVGLLGESMKDDKNGGAGATTASKEPWDMAAPWLRQQIDRGADLQSRYSNNPYSQQQLAAYGNQNALGDYMRQLTPSLLGQMQGQQLGYDPSNPSARPTGFTFIGDTSGTPGGSNLQFNSTQGGLLGSMTGSPSTAYTSAQESSEWLGNLLNRYGGK